MPINVMAGACTDPARRASVKSRRCHRGRTARTYVVPPMLSGPPSSHHVHIRDGQETTMGSAGVQGPLWGAAARDWAEIAEPGQIPFYEAAFDALRLDDATHLLDAGCGAGLALQLAHKRGASVAGVDAAEGFLTVAHERVPDADLRHGDIEALPFVDDIFDAVTAFNSVQYAS